MAEEDPLHDVQDFEDEVKKALAGIPERLRQIRGRRSRRIFCKALGPTVFQNLLLKYETGEARVNVEFIIRLALYEDIPPEWVLLGDDPK